VGDKPSEGVKRVFDDDLDKIIEELGSVEERMGDGDRVHARTPLNREALKDLASICSELKRLRKMEKRVQRQRLNESYYGYCDKCAHNRGERHVFMRGSETYCTYFGWHDKFGCPHFELAEGRELNESELEMKSLIEEARKESNGETDNQG